MQSPASVMFLACYSIRAWSLMLGKKRLSESIKTPSSFLLRIYVFLTRFLLLTPYLVKNAAQIWIRAKWRERLDALGCQYDAKRYGF